MPIPGHHSPARRTFGGIHTPTMKQPPSMWIFPHQQAEKSLQNQHVLSILQVGSHQLQYRFFRTKKRKSHHKTNTFCPITLKPTRPGQPRTQVTTSPTPIFRLCSNERRPKNQHNLTYKPQHHAAWGKYKKPDRMVRLLWWAILGSNQ